MSFYNFIRNEQSGADELHIDGEIVSDVDWFGPSGHVETVVLMSRVKD